MNNQFQLDFMFSEVPISIIVEIGRFLQQAEKLLTTDIGWEPQRQLRKIWEPRLKRMQNDLSQLMLLEEPTLIVAVTGGVKAGKTHISNIILGQPVLTESLRHETNRAWVVTPPAIAESDVFRVLEVEQPDWLRLVRFGVRIKNRNIILIDLPDFDAETELAEFRENRTIAEQVLAAADVIILVSTQAHNLTRRTFEWLTQFRQGHGFIFVYNEISGAEGSEAVERIRQLQTQVVKAGFAASSKIIGVPYLPGHYDHQQLINALAELPANRTLRSWRVADRVHQLVADIKAIYEMHQPQIQETLENIEQYIAIPLQNQFQSEIQLQVDAMQSTFQREMLFRLGQRIGGIFGGFISIRRILNYWSLPGLWFGSRLMGPTGALVAGGSVILGSLWRSFEAWRDRRRLKTKAFQPQLDRQDDQWHQQHTGINLKLEQAGFDPLIIPDANEAQKEQTALKEKIVQEIEFAFEGELNRKSKTGRAANFYRLMRRILWNFLPAIILGYAFVNICLVLVTQLPFLPPEWQVVKVTPGFSFYLNILTVLIGICYLQYLGLLILLRGSARRIGRQLVAMLTNLEHPFLTDLKERLNAPTALNQHAVSLEKEMERIQKLLRSAMKGIEVAESP